MNMNSYAALRAQLDFKKYARTWIFGVAQDFTMLALAWGAYSQLGFPGKVLASLILACVFFRAFGYMHEAVHGILSSNPKLNNSLGVFWGILCFLPYSQWKQGHLEHHYWAGNIEKDPVMKLVLYARKGGRFAFPVEVAWRCWFPVLATLQQFVFWGNCAALLARTKNSFLDWVSVAAPLGVWPCALYFAGWEFTVSVFVPAVFLYLLLVEIVNIPHHLQLAHFEGEHKIPVWDQHLISRSCTYPRWFERYVLLNFNFHVEHHLYPTLPFAELRKAHALLREAVGDAFTHNVEPGFSWIYHNRKKSLPTVLYQPPEAAAEDQMKRSS